MEYSIPLNGYVLPRSYGFLDVVFHHIADTHVAHHLFSYMPHYHAQEATQAIQKVRAKVEWGWGVRLAPVYVCACVHVGVLCV